MASILQRLKRLVWVLISLLFRPENGSEKWKTEAEGRRKVSEGYVNFATQLNDHIVVYATRKYLLREGEGFCITDLGKCSMSVGGTLEGKGLLLYDTPPGLSVEMLISAQWNWNPLRG